MKTTKLITKVLINDYTLNFRDFGVIIVPAGTKTTNRTACGLDDNYNFVDEFAWIDENYPTIAKILAHDARFYGINIPCELLKEI